MAVETPISAGIPAETSPESSRRSISIFSRKGVETPPPPSYVVPFSQRISEPIPKMPRQGSKLWNLGKHPARNTAPSGTILRAVPKAQDVINKPLPLTPLEMEMATSPNEEVLSAIGRRSSAQQPPSSSVSRAAYRSPSFRVTKREKKANPNPNMIGVWKDGKVQWWPDACGLPPGKTWRHSTSRSSQASVASRPRSPPIVRPQKSPRPKIQVIIPDHQINAPFNSVPSVPQSDNLASGTDTIIEQRESPHVSFGGVTAIRTSSEGPLITHMPTPQRPLPTCGTSFFGEEKEDVESFILHKTHPSFSSSSGSSQSDEDDDASNYSKRTSMTSFDGDIVHGSIRPKPVSLEKRTGSAVFSILSPVTAGVFDDAASLKRDTPKPTDFAEAKPQSGSGSPSQASSRKGISSRRGHKHLARLNTADISPAQPEAQSAQSWLSSPTLSEITDDLEAHLEAISEDEPFEWEDKLLLDKPLPKNRVPAPLFIPPKSSKRSAGTPPLEIDADAGAETARAGSAGQRSSSFPDDGDLARNHLQHRSMQRLSQILVEEPNEFLPAYDQNWQAAECGGVATHNISAEAAEAVILRIMESLETFQDLFSTAVLNRGFQRVYKRHELSLLRTTLKNISPAAWEFRESSPLQYGGDESNGGTPTTTYTPEDYFTHYVRDRTIIEALKTLIVQRCQSFLRSDTLAALSSQDPAQAQRFDDAFWRIWTFCKIFGCGKGREDEITAQMDWLRGGILAHQQTCTSSIIGTDDLSLSNVLLNASDHFAKGNPGGLTIEQLYDMTEIWTCLGVLIQGVQGRTEQAREYGVFDQTDVRGGDIDGEEAMLEEWHLYLLTHGLSTTLTLATISTLPDASVFVLAKKNGWTNWTLPFTGSRGTFLKEAVSRVYEQKIATSFSANTRKEELRRESRRRGASHAAELRHKKATGEYLDVGVSEERPISEFNKVMNALHSPAIVAPPLPVPPSPAVGPSSSSSSLSAAVISSSNHTDSSTACSIFEVPATISDCTSSRTASVQEPATPPPPAPGCEVDNLRVSMQHPLQLQMSKDDPCLSSDRAIYRIVEMGFTAEQARMALKATDSGMGLQIERAVEMLLRA